MIINRTLKIRIFSTNKFDKKEDQDLNSSCKVYILRIN